MSNPNMPSRTTQFKAWCEVVFASFGECEIDENRIINRTRYFNNAFIIELRCTHEAYSQCVSKLIKRFRGHCPSYRAAERRVLGREYDYIVVFTKDPLDADNFYTDDEGVLHYFKQQD